MRRSLYILTVIALTLSAPSVQASDSVEAINPSKFEALLNNERGNILVLNLWATWCAPCLVEIPDLLELESNLAQENVKLVGLSVDEPRGNTRQIEVMRDRRFPGFRTYARDIGDLDTLVSVVDPAWNEVVPTTYILDRDGTVRTRIQGKKSLEEFTAAVKAIVD